MEKKRKLNALREELRRAVKSIPPEDREKMNEAFLHTISDFCVDHVQRTAIDCAEDLGMDGFDTLVYVVPRVATELMQAMIVNLLLNADEKSIDDAGKLIDTLVNRTVDALKISDYSAAWKSVQTDMLKATMRGNVDLTSVDIKG